MSRAPMDTERYATFCAPTALAALLGCSRLEAAEYLTDAGCNAGDGGTTDWDHVLEDLGGHLVEHRTDEDKARWGDAWDRYQAGQRRTPPKPSLALPTVAEVLRRHPRGLYVVWTTSHTLVARHGEVIVDTRSTKSMRARVYRLYRFPDSDDVGLPPEEAEEIEEQHARVKANKAARRERRKAQRERRQATLEWGNRRALDLLGG